MGNDNSSHLSGINIKINASTSADGASVDAQGSTVTPLSFKDLVIFDLKVPNLTFWARKLPIPSHLNGYSLSRAVLGAKAPITFEILGPESWIEVKKTVRPVKTEIIKVYSEPAIAAMRKFTNESSVKGKYRVGVTHEEKNTITTTWTSKIDFNADMKIDYKIIKPQACGEINFKSSWSKETKEQEIITLGSENSVEVELEPGQSVVAKLRVTRCMMDVKVTYETSLDGDVLCLYENIWKLFSWQYVHVNINDVLRAGNQPTTKTTSEVLKICFSTDGEVLLSDS